MNTLINKVENLINNTPSGDNRNILTDINIILHQQLNLCDSCKQHPAECTNRYVNFGNGKSEGNIIKCTGYEYNN
jgi:hypothetical protein